MTYYQKVDVQWIDEAGRMHLLKVNSELVDAETIEVHPETGTLLVLDARGAVVFETNDLDKAKARLLRAYGISSGALNPRGLARLEVDFGKEERDRLLVNIDRLQQWIDDLQASCYINCVYCGHRYGPDDEVPATMADVLKAHIEQCPEHPLSHAKARIAELEAIIRGD